MSAKHFATTEPEKFYAPAGWEFDIYSLEPRNFWFAKTTLPICEGCHIVRYDFRSRVRFRAGMRAPRLQINFIDSYSAARSRLQGNRHIDSIVMITTKDDSWDGLSDVGALGIEINFDERLAEKILTPELSFLLTQGGPHQRSLVTGVSTAAMRLKTNALMMLNVVQNTSGLFDQFGEIAPTELDVSAQFSDEFGFAEDTLIELACNTITDCLGTSVMEASTGYLRRRDIALKVERMLWEPPFLQDDDFEGTLVEFGHLFDVSTKTIQIAIQEQFGIGFVAFRRLVRLTQLRRAIFQTRGREKLTFLSHDYRLHFGRLSREYRDLFGVSPSVEMRNLARASRA